MRGGVLGSQCAVFTVCIRHPCKWLDFDEYDQIFDVKKIRIKKIDFGWRNRVLHFEDASNPAKSALTQ